MTLDDKTCLITGAGSGIGRATALRFASEGADVRLVGRTPSKVEAVFAEIIEAGGKAEAYGVDVADREGVFGVVAEIERERAPWTLLVNNAGHSSPHRRLLSTPPDEIASVINSNLLGSIYCAQAVMPAMLERDSGTIVNVSSIAGLSPGLLGGMIYSAVKAAVINFTGHLNEEFKDTNVRASVVIPGEISTPLLDKRPVPPSAEARSYNVQPRGRGGGHRPHCRSAQNSSIPELVIRPTRHRDFSDELTETLG